MSLGKVYTFGPTFRVENLTLQDTRWFSMIEPEVAFMIWQEIWTWLKI